MKVALGYVFELWIDLNVRGVNSVLIVTVGIPPVIVLDLRGRSVRVDGDGSMVRPLRGNARKTVVEYFEVTIARNAGSA